MTDRQWKIETILDHYENPRSRGPLPGADIAGEGGNPGCSDRLRVYLAFGPGGVLARMSFDGRGCTLSQAAASLMTETLPGHTSGDFDRAGRDALVTSFGPEALQSRPQCATLALRLAIEAAEASQ